MSEKMGQMLNVKTISLSKGTYTFINLDTGKELQILKSYFIRFKPIVGESYSLITGDNEIEVQPYFPPEFIEEISEPMSDGNEIVFEDKAELMAELEAFDNYVNEIVDTLSQDIDEDI